MCLCRFDAGFAALHCLPPGFAAAERCLLRSFLMPGEHAVAPRQLLHVIQILHVDCLRCGDARFASQFVAYELRSLRLGRHHVARVLALECNDATGLVALLGWATLEGWELLVAQA